jgi:hypothetical protein
MKYQWQGEKIKVRFGNCIVTEKKDRPLYWWNYECHPEGKACIPAIEITTQHGNTFMIANHFGIGVHKLINGGWPNYTHFSLEGKFSTKPQLKYSEFDLDGYSHYEADREIWQAINYPEEYRKMKAIREAGRKIMLGF